MKRIFTCLLAAAMLLCMAAPVFAADTLPNPADEQILISPNPADEQILIAPNPMAGKAISVQPDKPTEIPDVPSSGVVAPKGIADLPLFTPDADPDAIKVYLDGKLLIFDVQPQIINDRTMVPLRAIFEAFGAEVRWIPEEQGILAAKDSTLIVMVIGSPLLLRMDLYTGTETRGTMDVPPQIVKDRTLVPLRAVSESLDLDVAWDGDTRTVTLTSHEMIENEKVYREYEGEYADTVSQRASLEADLTSAGMEIVVAWANSASEENVWEMTALYDAENSRFVYTDCASYLLTYDAEGNIADEKCLYENGEGYFTASGTQLLWDGAKDENCRACIFAPVPAN